ncbi:hypothetical protein KBK19_04305 [Microvirga sp. STR05]|uniref:General stress protein CsbD n=1 Tax=Hymenobacter duratus TaxID=2771356 RepID=A0ABR8JDY8_9BACT|nr:hypothetical protein [Hymenobacter duratus]MBD2714252.1 hypothetical protein [Hymenobacter duratus]MBR7949154.1 hypothetical protein [Microvirga sp. STR05]
MTDKQNEQDGTEWDDILNHLRQVRQQIREQGPLPEAEKAEVTSAFHRGLALLEGQARDMRGNLKGSSGKW